MSLRGAAYRRLLLGCGWQLRLAEGRFLPEEQTEIRHCTACRDYETKGGTSDMHVQPGHRNCRPSSDPRAKATNPCEIDEPVVQVHQEEAAQEPITEKEEAERKRRRWPPNKCVRDQEGDNGTSQNNEQPLW